MTKKKNLSGVNGEKLIGNKDINRILPRLRRATKYSLDESFGSIHFKISINTLVTLTKSMLDSEFGRSFLLQHFQHAIEEMLGKLLVMKDEVKKLQRLSHDKTKT